MSAKVPYIFLFAIVIIVSLCVGWFRLRKLRKGTSNFENELKQFGRREIVKFSDCEIKSREYNEEVPNDPFPSELKIVDSLFGHISNEESIVRTVSILICKIADKDGVVREFRSESIYLPLEMLRYRLEIKQETYIYIDKSNPNRYYFDLAFLGLGA
jgi:hypothetical protein